MSQFEIKLIRLQGWLKIYHKQGVALRRKPVLYDREEPDIFEHVYVVEVINSVNKETFGE